MAGAVKQNIIRFWQAIEALSPQDIPKPRDSKKDQPILEFDLTNDLSKILPWNDPSVKPSEKMLKDKKKWLFTVYLGVYAKKNVIRLIETNIGRKNDVFDGKNDGYDGENKDTEEKSSLAVLMVTQDGRCLQDSLVLSMCAWATGAIMKGGIQAINPPNLFRSFTEKTIDALSNKVPCFSGNNRVDNHGILDLVNTLFNLMNVSKLNENRVVIITRKMVGEDQYIKNPPDTFLNSYFLEDLFKIGTLDEDSMGQGLRQYLTGISSSNRVDLRKDIDKALSILNPSNFPKGKWPSGHPLVFSQQIAVNLIMEKLASQSGLFAINGPPGTGKTTLLRDIVAEIVVKRAMVLANMKDPNSAYLNQKEIVVGRYSLKYYPLKETLTGHSIVVASSNNGAVENVSQELPKEDSIEEKWKGKVDYFGKIATQIAMAEKKDRKKDQDEDVENAGTNCWALVAARLGKKENRDLFKTWFWFGDKEKDGKQKIEGLKDWFDEIQKGTPTSWEDAVKDFCRAKATEEGIRDRLTRYSTLGKVIADIESQILINNKQIDDMLQSLQVEQGKLTTAAGELERAKINLSAAKKDLFEWNKSRPRIFEIIVTLSLAYFRWNREGRPLKERERKKIKIMHTKEEFFRNCKKDLQNIETKRNRVENERVALAKKKEETSRELTYAEKSLKSAWPSRSLTEEKREISSFWAIEEWNNARTELFLEALNLHRVFFENSSARISKNLSLAMFALDGKLPLNSPLAWKTAFDSLTMVVPVISSTFASMSRQFEGLEQESLGWLLIDEAGQAVPQAAVGGIWRSKRTIVVGDPLQLEPIATIPATVESALGEFFKVDTKWFPKRTSVQALSDTVNDHGTFINSSGENQIWVGSPLRVHRRCDEPMFSISNEVAYDGMMINGKLSGIQGKDEDFLEIPSGWYHVKGSSTTKHWIDEEEEPLRQFLRYLTEFKSVKPADIILIAPFRSVSDKLEKLAEELFGKNKMRAGTIHVSQGKEARVVILVLGGNPDKPRAKQWASEKPNLINVAASRAKERLYVIGNFYEWKKYQHFSLAAEKLPLINRDLDSFPDLA